MKRLKVVWVVAFLVCFFLWGVGIGMANSSVPTEEELQQIYKQIQVLQERIKQLEEKLKRKEAEERELRKDIKVVKETRETIEKIKEKFGTLSIHGSAVTYYQAASSGENTALVGVTGPEGHFANPDSAGYVADLELTWKPLKNGEFYMRIHAGEGNGADEILEEGRALFADLNTLNDDNPDDSEIDVLEAYYTQELFDGMLSISFGKTEPVVFIDDNEFANDEVAQFVGKPFVNDPVLDSEDEFGPLLALSFNPRFIKAFKDVTITAVVQSSSYPRNEDGVISESSDDSKDIWTNFFRRPFVAGQITYSPTIKGLQGNYRIYAWAQTYKHDKIDTILGRDTGSDEGWGVGLSCDQYLTENIGVFGRFGYHNDEVYEVPVFYSVGAFLKGLIPMRKDDEIGIGFAGLKANHAYDDHHTEYHVEGYYKFVFSEYFAVTADLQCVKNPLGNNDNDTIWAGMLKGEFSF